MFTLKANCAFASVDAACGLRLAACGLRLAACGLRLDFGELVGSQALIDRISRSLKGFCFAHSLLGVRFFVPPAHERAPRFVGFFAFL